MDLFEWGAQQPQFGGVTFSEPRDGDRLRAQLGRVFAVMRDGRWHTPPDLEAATGDPWASISARLRDLRKPQFGGHDVRREYVARGLWKYRMVISGARSLHDCFRLDSQANSMRNTSRIDRGGRRSGSGTSHTQK